MPVRSGTKHSVESTNLADLLERVLDKGIVIAGDIKIKLVEVELLTIQIRLLICSVDRAKEMGIDWWATSPAFSSRAPQQALPAEQATGLEERLSKLEAAVAATPQPAQARPAG